jgi:hypothetical protein
MSLSRLLSLATVLLWVPSLLCAQGALVAKAATEIVEAMAKKSSVTAAREIAELGGEVAVRELLQEAEKQGGEALVRKVALLAGRHGSVALQATKGAPRIVAEAIEKLPQELAENGLRAVAREPLVMQKLITETGQEALEAAAKHPGIGGQIAAKLGREGAEVAAKASDDAARALARHADDLAKVASSERSAFLQMMKTAPEKCLAFLGKHPVGTLTAAVVASFLMNPDAYLGSADQPGFIERIAKEPARWLGMVAAALLAIWGLTKILLGVRASAKGR